LNWRRNQSPHLLPPFYDNLFNISDSPLSRTLSHDWSQVDIHQTAWSTGQQSRRATVICTDLHLTVSTSNLILLVNRPYMGIRDEARKRCLGAAHITIQIVHHLKQRAPESRFLRQRLMWSWSCAACIVCKSHCCLFDASAHIDAVARAAMDSVDPNEKIQIMADLNLAAQMVNTMSKLSSIKNFERVINGLNTFVSNLQAR
jgi:hypothetical protein